MGPSRSESSASKPTSEPEEVIYGPPVWSYKAVQIIPGRVRNIGDVTRLVWGADVFVWQVPLLKLSLLLHALMWWAA